MAMMPDDSAQAQVDAAVIDFHSHLIPGVDDGARDPTESREALSSMQASGVRKLITTPHFEASLAMRPDRFDARLDELDAAWAQLQALAREEFPDLELHRGVELKLDMPEPDLTDPRLRLAGGRFVLVEFPYFTIPPRSSRVLAYIIEHGHLPIIAHPERYDGISSDPEIVQNWKAVGAYLQVNGPSLVGRYGPEPRRAAILLVGNGHADYLSSDYHARGRTEIRSCRDLLIAMGGEAQAELLMSTNPLRLLAGDTPTPVPPLGARRGLWERIAAAFR